MPKNYREWKKNVSADESPDKMVLEQLLGSIVQYMDDPCCLASLQVLNTAISCSQRYLEEYDQKTTVLTTVVGRYTVKDTGQACADNGEVYFESDELVRIELRAALNVCNIAGMRGKELQYARKILGFGRETFCKLVGISEDELREIENENLIVSETMRLLVFLIVKNTMPREQVYICNPVGFEIDLTNE